MIRYGGGGDREMWSRKEANVGISYNATTIVGIGIVQLFSGLKHKNNSNLPSFADAWHRRFSPVVSV